MSFSHFYPRCVMVAQLSLCVAMVSPFVAPASQFVAQTRVLPVAVAKPAPKAQKPKVISQKSQAASQKAAYAAKQELLAKVMWHEARGQGRLGMLATGIVTLNRVVERHNGHKTLQSVVNAPYAYSWVANPQPQHFNPRSVSGHAAMQVADRLLSGHLLADERALAGKLGAANHFHAASMKKYPKWAKSPQLTRVALTKDEEKALGAVFYAPAGGATLVASR